MIPPHKKEASLDWPKPKGLIMQNYSTPRGIMQVFFHFQQHVYAWKSCFPNGKWEIVGVPRESATCWFYALDIFDFGLDFAVLYLLMLDIFLVGILCRRVVRPWLGLKMLDLNDMIVAQLKEKDAKFPSVSKGVLVPMVWCTFSPPPSLSLSLLSHSIWAYMMQEKYSRPFGPLISAFDRLGLLLVLFSSFTN